jgi:hypothetical protein
MSRQSLKDLLFKQWEKSWKNFLDHVSTAEADLNGKLDDLAQVYGPTIVGRAINEERIELKLRVGGGNTPIAPPKVAKKISVKKRPKKMKLTKKGRASHILQATYLNHLRHFKGATRTMFMSLAKDKGRQAAVNAMAKALKKIGVGVGSD